MDYCEALDGNKLYNKTNLKKIVVYWGLPNHKFNIKGVSINIGSENEKQH